MMVGANIPNKVQFMVHREALDTACILDGQIPITIDGITKSTLEHWIGKHPFCKSLTNMERSRYSDLYSRHKCQIGR